MATSVPKLGQIPFSNNGGNNQFSPGAGVPKAAPAPINGGMPGAVTAGPNTFSPPTPIGTPAIPSAGGPGAQVPNVGGLDPGTGNKYGTVGGLDKQLKDIWGKGVGGALGKLLEGMSGTDSQVLQEFIQSLIPEEAKASANISTNLGAHGVSANSSVNAIAQGDLQAQEFAAISGESAKLTMSQEDLTAQILESMMDPAAKEVASSGWGVFASVMNNITGDIGNLSGGSYKTPNGNQTPTGDFSPQQLNFGGAPPDASGLDGFSQPTSPDMGIFG